MLNISFIHWLVILSAVINFYGYWAYISDTLKGKTKPNRISWFIWGISPLIGAGAAISAGASIWATALIFLEGVMPITVFIASFVNPKSYWKVSKADIICGFFALLGLILWLVVDQPVLAILFAIIGDSFATYVTISKAWKFPETETGITYVLGLLSILLILPSIPEWNIENSAFQIYILLANFILAFAVYRKKIRIKK